jgi:hypothetical protein
VSAPESYVDFRMREWGMLDQSPRLQSSVRKVLNELSAEGLLTLKDPKLEVMVLPGPAGPTVWACPVYSREAPFKLRPKPETRVLLLLNAGRVEEETFEGDLRHQLGHVLCYLCSPRPPHVHRFEDPALDKMVSQCAEADREWHRFTERTRMEEFAAD